MSLRPFRLYLVRRRRPSLALACGAIRDPVALSRLGLHRAAVRLFEQNPDDARRHPVDRIRSLAACGEREAALKLGRAEASVRSQALALALAPLEASLALEKYRGGRMGLRAGLAAAAGRQEEALALASLETTPDARFLEASLLRADPERSAAAWCSGFGAFGMAPPQRRDPDRPVCVTNATAPRGGDRSGPLISVVMPTRNAAENVAAAVRSVLDQSWTNLELLFVDDASEDDTIARALGAAAGDPRFRLLRHTRRGGAYRARNTALEAARGRWVAFQDSDEWAHPQRLAIQAEAMQRGKLVAATARSLRVDSSGEVRARGVWSLTRWAPSTLIFDRSRVMAQAGVFDEVLSGADNEYWWRLTQLFGPGRVRLLRTPVILGAWRADSLTGSAVSGFGGKGYNLDRVDYWEAWTHWHARNLRAPRSLRLEPGQRPFPVPPGLHVPD